MKIHDLLVKILVIASITLITVSAASAKGKKYGVFVGINKYSGGISELKGCVNDATKMQQTLIAKFGFQIANTTLLTDADATREKILAALKTYQDLAVTGDVFVFYYSGHGTLFSDKYSEYQDETELTYLEKAGVDGKMEVLYERDKYDSAIVPVDARSMTSGKPWRNLILDDELYKIFSEFTHKGVKVDLISDSCNSGTLLKASLDVKVQWRTVPLPMVFGALRFSDLKFGDVPAANAAQIEPPVKGLYMSLTASRDDEFSLDLSDKNDPRGLFTSTLLQFMNARGGTKLTYQQLMTDKVGPAVTKAAKVWDNNQNPQMITEWGAPKSVIFGFPPAK